LTRYFIRRVLEAIPLLLGISVIAFLIMQAVPGGPLSVYGNDPAISADDIARLREQLGLTQPLYVQYLRWLGNLLQGNWGDSYFIHRPVIELVLQRLPNTVLLMGVGFLISLLVAVPVGVLSAVRPYSLFDSLATSLALVGVSVPIFWSGLMLIVLFSQQLGWLPGGGMYSLGTELRGSEALVDRLKHLVLPTIVLGLSFGGQYTRYVRSSMLEVVNQDYIRTARAKGLKERLILRRHAMKNAAIPVVTVVALDLPFLVTGAVFTETIFSWPGMGRLFWDAAIKLDYPILMALMLIAAVLVVVFNLLADLLYAFLDPRLSYASART
jgi:peptide/nickel transport system permease protein